MKGKADRQTRINSGWKATIEDGQTEDRRSPCQLSPRDGSEAVFQIPVRICDPIQQNESQRPKTPTQAMDIIRNRREQAFRKYFNTFYGPERRLWGLASKIFVCSISSHFIGLQRRRLLSISPNMNKGKSKFSDDRHTGDYMGLLHSGIRLE